MIAPLRIGFLCSHGGSIMQAVLRACGNGNLAGVGVIAISNNSQCVGLESARAANIPTVHLSSVTHPIPEQLDAAISQTLLSHQAQLIILSGYMRLLGSQVLGAYRERVLNVHPSLLPHFGGHGMYGDRVHQAVLATNQSKTGVTVHIVDPIYDHGRILAQREIPVIPGDTVESLRGRVQAAEGPTLIEVLKSSGDWPDVSAESLGEE